MADLGSDNVKLLMFWDINKESEQDYFEFVVRELSPGITRLGLEQTGVWYTAYSHDDTTPQIMTEGIAEDLDAMKKILQSQEWKDLSARLMEYVSNYRYKIVRVSGDFQL